MVNQENKKFAAPKFQITIHERLSTFSVKSCQQNSNFHPITLNQSLQFIYFSMLYRKQNSFHKNKTKEEHFSKKKSN
jgi:hypothetical protein